LSDLSGAGSQYELFQFFKYHAVGHSTGPNTHPLFSGRPLDDSEPESLKGNSTFESASVGSRKFKLQTARRERFRRFTKRRATEGKTGAAVVHSSKEPIWHLLNQSSYVTAYINQMCEEWGSEYNNGHDSADHELVLPFCAPEYHAQDKPFGVMMGPYSSRRRCLGAGYVHQIAVDYARSFWSVYSDVPKFMTVGFLEGHEGTGEVVRTIDSDLSSLIRWLMPAELASNTILLLISDHGLHMSPFFVYTDLGRLEHMNPLLVMLAPRNYVSEHSAAFDALRANEQALITSADVYQTIREILADSSVRDQDKEGTGLSLFRPVAPSRTCAEAGIPKEFCKCNA